MRPAVESAHRSHVRVATCSTCVLLGASLLTTPAAATVAGAPPAAAVVGATVSLEGSPPRATARDAPSVAAPSLATPARALPATAGKKAERKVKKKRRFAPRATAHVRIRSVGIARFVYKGGQRTIDRARVAHYTGWRDTFTRPGRPGVYWLAAHNYGRSGPFHRLLRIRTGARIVVTTRSGERHVYRVVAQRVVRPYVKRSVVWGRWAPRAGPPRAVLQTCVGKKRLLVYADLVRRR